MKISLREAIFLLSLWLSGIPFLQAQPVPAERFVFSRPLMGTEVRIVLYARGPAQARFASDLAYACMDSLNAILSDYDPESELNQLSDWAGTGKRRQVSQPLWAVMATADSMSKASDGAFDMTVGPLSRLWRRAFRRQVFPDSAQLARALSRVNYQWIRFSPRERAVRLKKEGMQLDAGGLAKGFIADQALKVLRIQGQIQSALIDAGGDIVLMGKPPGRKGWEIALPSVKKGNGPAAEAPPKVFLSRGSMASSGDHYQFLEHQGIRYSHIIDPRTGLGAQERRLVTVWHAQGIWADAWASALSLVQDPVSLLESTDIPLPIWVQIIWEGEDRSRRWRWGTMPVPASP